jgi:hypothetical protein
MAWCEYGSPDELPNIYHLKEYNAGLDVAPDFGLYLYDGTRSPFERAGFGYERSKGKNHCVMRRTITPLVPEQRRG